MKKNISFAVALTFLVFPYAALFAQQESSKTVEQIREYYDQLLFAEAEKQAQEALKKYENFTPGQLEEIHKILGLIYFSQNKPTQAREQFENALSLNADLKLDPLYVSPKILEFFDSVKRDWLAAKKEEEQQVSVRYLVVEDTRPAAALRSMVLPGWGQFYKGEKKKGIVLSTLWGVGVVGTVLAHIARNNAEDDYLAETDPQKIGSRFSTFNNYHKLRNSLAAFSAAVWVVSYLDAILSRSHSHPQPARKVSFSPNWMGHRPGLTLRWIF